MKQRKKRLGIWIILLAILFLGQYIVPVKASTPEITDANIQMVGGQIRTITPMGLRMIGCIKKSYIQELENTGAIVQYGIVLLPKSYLGDQELKIDGKYLYNGSVYKAAKVPAVKKFAEKDDRIYFTAVLANLAKERYKNDYAARAYVEITRSVEQEDGSSKNETEILYSDRSIDRQVYKVAQDAVDGKIETEENKQWLRENILNPVDNPEAIPEEDKKIPFQLGKVSGVTLYHKSEVDAEVEEVSHFTVEGFKPDEYLVKVEMEDQPEVFAEISKVSVSENNQVSFELKLDNYVTEEANQTKQGAIVEFGTASEGEASTKYITMQSLIDKIKENPAGSYTLEHDIDASAVQGNDYLIENFTGTFDGKGYKIKGLTTTLFGTVSGGTVKNMKLENVSITKTNNYGSAGGGTLANKAENNAVIEGIHVNGSLKSNNSRELLGGLVGRMDYAKVSQCSTNLEITGSFNTTGGLIGQMSNQQSGPNIIENSYAVGSISGNKTNGAIGGLIGWHNCKTNFSVTNCYAAVTLEVSGTGNGMEPGGFIGNIGESDATGILKNNISYSNGTSGYKFDGASTADKYNVQGISELYALKESKLKKETSRASQFTKVAEVSVDELLEKEFYTKMGWDEDVWDFAPLKEGKTPVLKNGDSNMTTMLEMKEISSVEDLQNIKKDLSGVYSLTTDIDVSEVTTSNNVIISGTFKGMLKGNGHQIIGQKAPLFEKLNGAKISRLALKNILVAGGENTGALAGTAQNSTVSEVWAEGLNVNPYGPLFGQDSDRMVGGLIAYLNGGCHISDSYVGGEITVNGKYQGGVIGYSEYDTSNTVVKQVVSNMRTKATSNQTNGSGFIGIVQMNYDMQTWMENSIAIGEAGADKKQGSIGEAYRFTATTGASMQWSLSNCYQAKVSGKSNISSGSLEETTEYKNPDFYRNKLKFDRTKWNFADVEKNGYPTLIWIAGEEPLPPLPQGSEVTKHPLLQENPLGYTEIRTPADFMKIANNPSGKYILMNNISLEQVKLPEGQTSYIMKRFEGELDGNNQVIHGLRASLFDSISGTSSKKATVKNLRIQNVFVDAGMKTEYGLTRRGEANGLAREISNGILNSIYMNVVKLNGGNNTAALGGLVDNTYIGKVWLEGIDINRNIVATELQGFNLIGGAVARLSGYSSKFEDSYVAGSIIMDNNQQGGAVGEVQAAVIRNVISNMEARSNKPANWREKSGFLGAVSTMGTNGTKWYLDRCIAIGNAGSNYKFLGRDLTAVTTNNVNKCYEYAKGTGNSNVSDNTIQKGTLLVTENIHDIALYKDILTFNASDTGADPNAWDFGTVTEKGYPTLKWLLTYDHLPTTPVEEPLLEKPKNSENPETVSREEVVLPEQEENLTENAEKDQDDKTATTPKKNLEDSEITSTEKEEDLT